MLLTSLAQRLDTQSTPEKQPTFENNENLQLYTSELEIAVKEEEEPKRQDEALYQKALQQSPKLAAMITLSIGLSEGPQHAIVMEELDESEDGVAAWAKLVKHFERSTHDLRLDTLLSEWEHEELQVGEHPDELYARLSSINRKLKAIWLTTTLSNYGVVVSGWKSHVLRSNTSEPRYFQTVSENFPFRCTLGIWTYAAQPNTLTFSRLVALPVATSKGIFPPNGVCGVRFNRYAAVSIARGQYLTCNFPEARSVLTFSVSRPCTLSTCPFMAWWSTGQYLLFTPYFMHFSDHSVDVNWLPGSDCTWVKFSLIFGATVVM